MLSVVEGSVSTTCFFPEVFPWPNGYWELDSSGPSLPLSPHPLTWWKLLSSLNLQWFLSYHHRPQLLKPVLRKGFVISHLHMCMNKHQINSLTSLRTICISSEQRALCHSPHFTAPKVTSGDRKQMGLAEIKQEMSTTFSDTLIHPHFLAKAFFSQV